jgi:hypothetical protein
MAGWGIANIWNVQQLGNSQQMDPSEGTLSAIVLCRRRLWVNLWLPWWSRGCGAPMRR